MKNRKMSSFVLSWAVLPQWMLVMSLLALASQSTVVAGENRYMFLSNQDSNTITYYNQNGVLIGVFADASKGIQSPIGITFDCNGHLLVANYGTNTVRKLTAQGEDLGNVITLPYGGDIRCVAVDRHNLYYVTDNANNLVKRYTAAGLFIDDFASTGLDGPEGMAFDAAGNLYVANYGGGNIRKISPAGVDLGDFITGLTQPTELTIDSCGKFYVVQDNISAVAIYDSGGSYISDAFPAGFNGRLIGAGMDGLGGLYVVGHDNNVVYKVCDGTASSFAASMGTNPNSIAFGPAKLLNW